MGLEGEEGTSSEEVKCGDREKWKVGSWGGGGGRQYAYRFLIVLEVLEIGSKMSLKVLEISHENSVRTLGRWEPVSLFRRGVV